MAACFPLSDGRHECVTPHAGIPLLGQPVPAGIPTPVTDGVEAYLSFDQHLVSDPETCFALRVAGHSMTGFGIHDGDLLVVDRASPPQENSIVIAVVDGRFTVKQLSFVPQGVLLRGKAGSSLGQGDLLIGPEQDFALWGVVRWAIHPL